MAKHRVVIVGGGFAGLNVAKGLRKADAEVILVDRSNHHLFQPLLYQVAMGGLSPSEIANPLRMLLRKQRNVACCMGEVTRVDLQSRTLELDNGAQSFTYDTLVLAAGGMTNYFGKDEWAQFAPGLKTVDDARDIRERVLLALEKAERSENEEERKKLMTMVVIGGGPTGVEMAGGFSELTRSVLRWDFRRIQPQQARVLLIDGGDRLLSGMDPSSSAYTKKKLESMGVEVHLHERVQEIKEGWLKTDQRELEAGTIVWGGGVSGHPLAKLLDVEKDRGGRILVGPDLRVKGLENVYCLGDMASFQHEHTYGGKPLPGLAPVAMQQGNWAARNIRQQLAGKLTGPFHYLDKGSMATIGRTSAVAESMGLKLKGVLAWLAWLFIHILYLLDLQNQILVLIRWAYAYFTWKWNSRLITRIPKPQPSPAGSPSPNVAAPHSPAAKDTSHPAEAAAASPAGTGS